MSFKTSEDVVVSIIKCQKAGSSEAVVIGANEDRLQVALKGLGLILKHGNLLHVRSLTNECCTAWASVENVALAGDVKIVSLGNIRFETMEVRAARCPIELSITANYSDRQENSVRTQGQSIDLSVSGLRAKLERPLPLGSLVHVTLRLEEDKTLDAVAEVVRICDGSQTASGGFEVGLEFQRYFRGYEHLIQITPEDQAA
jgi:PilZ domain